MASSFPILLTAIAVVGTAHTIVSHFRSRAEQRRRREALIRLGFRTGEELK